MNPFYAAGCALMVGATVHAYLHGNPLAAGIAACYAVANALLAFVKG